jgi:hypothetical protein
MNQKLTSPGSDSIPMKFIKTFKFFLIPFLLFLMNLSIITSCVPTACRISRVTAIHKMVQKKIRTILGRYQIYRFSLEF